MLRTSSQWHCGLWCALHLDVTQRRLYIRRMEEHDAVNLYTYLQCMLRWLKTTIIYDRHLFTYLQAPSRVRLRYVYQWCYRSFELRWFHELQCYIRTQGFFQIFSINVKYWMHFKYTFQKPSSDFELFC